MSSRQKSCYKWSFCLHRCLESQDGEKLGRHKYEGQKFSGNPGSNRFRGPWKPLEVVFFVKCVTIPGESTQPWLCGWDRTRDNLKRTRDPGVLTWSWWSQAASPLKVHTGKYKGQVSTGSPRQCPDELSPFPPAFPSSSSFFSLFQQTPLNLYYV